MSSSLVEDIRRHMSSIPTEELQRIYHEHDTTQYSPEAFEAVRLLLSERGKSSATLNFSPDNMTPNQAATISSSANTEYHKQLRLKVMVSFIGIILLLIGLIDVSYYRSNDTCGIVWCNNQAITEVVGVTKKYIVHYCDYHRSMANILRYPLAACSLIGLALTAGGIHGVFELISKKRS